jgi:sulfatase maturation enzyme AslB (radical SAM superfamily)
MSIEKWFPPEGSTACLQKWSQVSLYLWENKSSSCHRNQNAEIPDDYDFNNTAPVVEHREKMLRSEWPSDGRGCEHCRDQEIAGGMSDRLNYLSRPENKRYVPIELYKDPTATRVKPTQLSVHFNNKCNLKCLYCGPNLSSAWVKEVNEYENIKDEDAFNIDPWELDGKYKQRLDKFYQWMQENYSSLKAFDLLGGEPFIQKETWDCVDWMIAHPNLECDVEIYSNMQVKPVLFKRGMDKLRELSKTVKEVRFVASVDCWGAASEYIRNGMDLATFEENMNYLVNECPEIIPTINSTVSALSIPYIPELIRKVIEWNKTRTISVNYNKCIDPVRYDPHIMPTGTYTKYIKEILELNKLMYKYDTISPIYAEGIFNEIENSPAMPEMIDELKRELDKLDSRRSTNWRVTFPWLESI